MGVIVPISFTNKGSWEKTDAFLKRITNRNIYDSIDRQARMGVAALASATPAESGLSSQSWDYEVKHNKGSVTITWTNSNIVGGVPVVILLQYGHGTGTGGYVQGRDFINPALRPIFDQIADNVWKAVTSA